MAGLGRKTFVAGDVLLAQELNDYLMDQSVMNFASEAARSSAIPTPTEGMLALTKDNDEIDYYNGSAWVPALPIGSWTSWSPVLSGGWVNGNGTWDAYYSQSGKTVQINATFTVGSTTTKGTGLVISLPVSAARGNNGAFNVIGSVGGSGVFMLALITSATEITMQAINASATYATRTGITATVPATWATGNAFHFTGTYEAA
jgi:hypothetical protein